MPAPRIILMYISEVSGHHNATLAIEKAIKILSPESDVININAFNYTNPVSEKIVNRLYMSLIKRTPAIWEYLYDNPTIVRRINRIKNTIHKFNSPKLKNLFDRIKPHAVACTQAFPCGMVADFKKTYQSNIPLIAVLTDYIPHSYWIYETIDYYITPSEEVRSRLNQKGVAPEKIKVFGIPFDPKFNMPVKKEEVLRRLGLKPGCPTILIMGGGQGLGPIKTVVKTLEKVPQDFQEIIITGVNRKLYNALKKRRKKFKKRILLLGYVNNIQELMGVSDLIITKPGGVTTAEALAKKIPIIIVKPIPGQEANNTEFLIGKMAAVKAARVADVGAVIADLLSHPEKLKRLSDAAGRVSKPRASLDIAQLLLDEARVYKAKTL